LIAAIQASTDTGDPKEDGEMAEGRGGFGNQRTITGYRPMARCESCGEEIISISAAGVIGRPKNAGDFLRVRILCKEKRCFAKADPSVFDKLGNVLILEDLETYFGWEELETYLYGLLFNLGVTRGEAFEKFIALRRA